MAQLHEDAFPSEMSVEQVDILRKDIDFLNTLFNKIEAAFTGLNRVG